MNKRIKTFLLSLLTPGLGYLQSGNKRFFYWAMSIYAAIIFIGATGRLFISIWGIKLITASLFILYLFCAIHATSLVRVSNPKRCKAPLIKVALVCVFLLISGLSFANRKTILGFDILRMGVPAMQPTIQRNERFLVDTWAYKATHPKRGDIIVHSFDGQKGLYVNRVIAIEGDKIAITGGIVFLNGEKLNEPYALPSNIRKLESKEMNELVIPKGRYFVMGDNRDKSFGDSRFSSVIGINNIVGEITDIIGSQDRNRIGENIE